MAAFTNRATLSYNGRTTASNVVTGEIVGALTMTKTALSEEYSPGGGITYAVTIVNSGASAIDGLTLTDDLGAYDLNTLTLVPLTYVDGSAKYFVNGVPQPDPAVSAGTSLTVSGVSVPAGGSAVIVYNTTVNSFASPEPGATIVNTVSVAGSKAETEVSASETVAAAEEPVLEVAKSLCPASVAENGELTYTFVITNSGGADSEDAVLTDTFDPVLSDIAVTLDGAALASGTGYTYDPVTGEFSTAAGVISVPAATFTQDAVTGEWTVAPGSVTLTVTGTV